VVVRGVLAGVRTALSRRNGHHLFLHRILSRLHKEEVVLVVALLLGFQTAPPKLDLTRIIIK
jgi:hypothetical protein